MIPSRFSLGIDPIKTPEITRHHGTKRSIFSGNFGLSQMALYTWHIIFGMYKDCKNNTSPAFKLGPILNRSLILL